MFKPLSAENVTQNIRKIQFTTLIKQIIKNKALIIVNTKYCQVDKRHKYDQ